MADEQLESLLNEPISADETSLLVRRLTDGQFPSEQFATLGDVVEATRADPIDAAQILREIRQGSFDDRMQSTFGEHGERIERLETDTAHLKSQVPLESEEALILKKIVQERRQALRGAPIALVALLVLAAILTSGLFFQSAALRPSSPISPTHRRVSNDFNGVRISLWEDGSYHVVLPDGTFRDASPAEIASTKGKLDRVMKDFPPSPMKTKQ